MRAPLPSPGRRAAARLGLLLSLCVGLACGGPPAPPPKTGTPAKGETTKETVKPAMPVEAPVAEIRDEIILSLVFASPETLLRAGLAYVDSAIPAQIKPMLQPDMLKTQLFKGLGLAGLERAIDTNRPIAVAIADPKLHKGKLLGPTMIAIPVLDGDALVTLLGRLAQDHQSTTWKDHIFTMHGTERVYLRLRDNYAFFAGHEKTLAGAPGVLLPLVQQKLSSDARLIVDAETIYTRFADEIEKGISEAKASLSKVSLDKISIGKMVVRWLGFVKGMRQITLDLSLEPQRILFATKIEAKPQSAFLEYMGKLSAGEPWGARYLPKDAVLGVLFRQNVAESRADLDDLLKLAKGNLDGPLKEFLDEKVLDAFKTSFEKLLALVEGETAFALEVGDKGGVNIVGAMKSKDAPKARAEMAAMLQLLSKEMNRVIAKVLVKAKKQAPGFNLKLAVKPGGFTGGGAKGDLFELVISYPKLKDKDKAKKVDEVKKAITKLMGPRFTVAYASAGDAVLFAMGKDYAKRLTEALAAAKGGGPIEKAFADLVGKRRMSFAVHVPLATLAEGILRAVEQVTPVPEEVKSIIKDAMPAPGKDLPATFVHYVDSPKLAYDLSISSDLITALGRAGMSLYSKRGQP
jgi:hypothetical protein